MMVTRQSDDFVKRSLIYQDYLAERNEILKHKWIESQKAGYDIGLERALTDWCVKYRAGWCKWRRSQQSQQG